VAGFRSPLFILGISAAPDSQAGVRSMLAPWMGGASAAAEVTTVAGVRSMLGFWLGGACAAPAPTPTPPASGGGFGSMDWDDRHPEGLEKSTIADENSEILDLSQLIYLTIWHDRN
jgi:hypothetical protein